jgi:hypothetical protein
VNSIGLSCLARHCPRDNKSMLWTVGIVLLVVWLVGLATFHTFGGFLHILFVIAIVLGLVQIISGRRAI